jgi:NAD(P)-dependent dehydrogenase (short-subunit alcohol dehydrogenase family)
MREFHGKVAFVTGAASGIGFALARVFGRADMKVMLADIDANALKSAVSQLEGEGIVARGVACDVADRASMQHAAAATLAAFGKVHILCNNAGVVCVGPIEYVALGDWDWVIGVNLMSVVYAIQAFLPHIKAHGEGGHVVTTASLAGMLCVPGLGPYNASKFGVVAISETLAAELAGTSIGVSVLCPGFVRTRIHESARNRLEQYGTRTEASPETKAQFADRVEAGVEPDEIAEKVIRAIKDDEFYIFTHPELRGLLEGCFQRILAAYPAP